MLPMGATDEYRDESGHIRLVRTDVHPGWVGVPLRTIEAKTGARIAYLQRYGEGLLPTPEGVLQENDVLRVLVRVEDTPTVERILTKAPEVS
jgi:trk system potassium uptake protein TrkA